MKRACVLIWQGKAEIISTYEDSFERSVDYSIPSPSVIRLLKFQNVPRHRKAYLSRRNVLRRDDFTCGYCGAKPKDHKKLTMDHIVPRSRGGKHTWKNVVCCCFSCNQQKGNLSLDEIGWKLRIKPYEPEGSRRVTLLSSNDTHSTWREWLEE